MDSDPSSRKQAVTIGYVFAAMIGMLLLQWLFATYNAVDTIPYSEFERLLAQGNVAEVTVGQDMIQGKVKEKLPSGKSAFVTVRVDPALSEKLEAKGVVVTGVASGGLFQTILSWIVPALMFYLIWIFLFRRLADRQGFGGLMSIGKSRAKVYVEKDTKVTFADVAGVDEAKFELQEVVSFLKDPKSYGRLGAHVPKGILLVGPPGTGKTLLARAVAGEAGVPFFSISGSEFVEMFVGVGAARVRDLFEQARNAAPCIIFIDELDALGRSRTPGAFGGYDEKEQTLNQLLSELDGFDPSAGVILLAATNRPEILDPALLRAGRFDRQVLVDRPDKVGRIAILKVHIRKIKIANDVDLDKVAALTAGFTGADIANLINEAAIAATRRSAEEVAFDDFTVAIERIVAGIEKKSRVLGREERRRVAYHEMGHALVAANLPGVDSVQKVSIIPRGVGALGYTLQRPTEDRFLLSVSELKNRIAVLMGGRASERLIFDGDVSTGAADDLQRATEIAVEMVTKYGMDPGVGQRTYAQRPQSFLAAPQDTLVSAADMTGREIDLAVRNLVEAGDACARAILEAHRADLDRGVELLIAKETLTAEEFEPLRPVAADKGAVHVPELKSAGSRGEPSAAGLPRQGHTDTAIEPVPSRLRLNTGGAVSAPVPARANLGGFHADHCEQSCHDRAGPSGGAGRYTGRRGRSGRHLGGRCRHRLSGWRYCHPPHHARPARRRQYARCQGLPLTLDASSLRVEGDGGAKLTIGSIDTRPPRPVPPANLSEIDKRIEALKDERANWQGAIVAAQARRKFAERFAEASPAGLGEKGEARPLSEWRAAFAAIFEEVAAADTAVREAQRKQREIDREIARLESDRSAKPPAKLEVRIDLAAQAATKATLRVTYAVRNAHWTPIYDARLDTGAKDRRPALELVRRAEIVQTTGEDWSNVTLGVSTLRTTRGGNAPELNTLIVQYPQLPRPMAAGTLSDAAPQRTLRAAPPASALLPQSEPNEQRLRERAEEQQAAVEASGFQVTFRIPGRVSIGAADGAKSLRIATATIAPDLLVRSAPVADPTAFLEASFKQAEDAPLLPGRVSIYRDGSFVGRGRMPAAGKDETVRLGFGADDKVKIERTVLKRNEGSAGLIVTTSKTDERSFKTSVRNGHDFPIRIAIEDQLPVSENEEIVVEMLPSTTPPTATNLRDKRGVLEWSFEAKAGEVKDIGFAWRVRWPKDKGVVMTPAG